MRDYDCWCAFSCWLDVANGPEKEDRRKGFAREALTFL
jgi:hypothetical protein